MSFRDCVLEPGAGNGWLAGRAGRRAGVWPVFGVAHMTHGRELDISFQFPGCQHGSEELRSTFSIKQSNLGFQVSNCLVLEKVNPCRKDEAKKHVGYATPLKPKLAGLCDLLMPF